MFPILIVQKNIFMPTPSLTQPRRISKAWICGLKFTSALFVTAGSHFYESSVTGREA